MENSEGGTRGEGPSDPIADDAVVTSDLELDAPPPPPVVSKSLLARIWEALPAPLRAQLERRGIDAGEDLEAPLADEAGGGMIIGPPSAGKTTLIAAMWQACTFRTEGEPYDLMWRPSQDTEAAQRLALLLRKSVEDVLRPAGQGQQVVATDTDDRYAFGIDGLSATRGWHTRRAFSLSLAFHDGPGGAMLGEDDSWTQMAHVRERMIRDTVPASSLVLCFDARIRHVKLLSRRLPQLLPLLADPSSRGRLRARRVLILLNKVDLLCQRHVGERTDVTARYLAERLDPVAQALEVVGVGALRAIRGAMRPDAELAIGVCSTWGFAASGRALFDERGSPLWMSEHDRGSDDEFLQQWRPFGVREALVYLACGRVGPTLRVVEPSDLVDRTIPPLEIPY